MSARIPPPLPPRPPAHPTTSTSEPQELAQEPTHQSNSQPPLTEDIVPSARPSHDNPLQSSSADVPVFDAGEWKRKIEDEEIQRYLVNFARHVSHLRADLPPPGSEVVHKPRVNEYTHAAIAARRKLVLDSGSSETEPLASATLTEKDEEEEEEEEEGTFEGNSPAPGVDWVAFISAYCRYLAGPTIPPRPVEPFTVARLRSNAERLYAIGQPTWSAFGKIVGDVLLWKDKWATGLIVIIYAILVFTSTLLPALLLLPLYPLLSSRFFPPSPVQQYQAVLNAEERLKEASELSDELAGLNETETVSQGLDTGLGIKVELTDLKERIRLGQEGIGLGSGSGSGSGDVNPKKEDRVKRRHRLKATLQKYEEEYGAGAVVVIGDLADLHEKVKNLYLWRNPPTAYTFAASLLTASLASYYCPLWVLVKLFQIAIGVVAFVVVPLVAQQERYEPMAWMAGDAPTDAEYAIGLLKQRERTVTSPVTPSMASGLSLLPVTPSRTGLASPHAGTIDLASKPVARQEKLKAIGTRGLDWLETARQVTSGESELRLARSKQLSSGKSTQISLGSGPSLTISPRSHDQELVTTYFAQRGRSPGNLRVSSTSIKFQPLIPVKVKAKASVGPRAEADAGTASQITRNPEITIPLSDIVGIRKRDKTSLFVVVSAGLELECVDGSITKFVFVAERDEAFARILALSERRFAKV